MKSKWIFICVALVSSVLVIEPVDAIPLDTYFQGYNGTFVLRDLSDDKTRIYNEDLAQAKLPPQSTFKIVNALIGLQTGEVSDENHLKKWDGKIQSYSAHNRDHTLASAIRHSVVWYFQDMARGIGADRMQAWLDQIDYGNKDISGGIDTFWLESSLRISPIEQVDFIVKLYKEELPFEKRVIQTVKRMITLQQEDSFVFAGKTGTKSNLGGGWFVGYVTQKDKTYAFATYIAGPNASGPKAKEITENIIQGEILNG